jgi:N-acetylneuraminate lyase
MPKFEGIYPAIITPMTAEGKLNEDAFRKVMEFNIQAGVNGFWVAGGMGESVKLDDEVNMRLAEIAADQARGRVKIIMHVGSTTTARSAKMAEHAARAGVDAVSSVPPFFYGPTEEELLEYYRVVAAAADLPFFVYNFPSSTGLEFSPELMARVQEKVPQLQGLKHSALTFFNVRVFAKMGLDCLSGWSMLMLPALTLGAAGTIDGAPIMAPERYVEVFRAFKAGDLARAMAAQEKASEVTDLVSTYGVHGTAKAVLSERLGIDCGDPILPGLPLAADQRASLMRRVTEMGLIGEPVAQPAN